MHIRQNPRVTIPPLKTRPKGFLLVNYDKFNTSHLSDGSDINILAASWDSAESIITMEHGRFAILEFAFDSQPSQVKGKYQFITITRLGL